MFEDGVGKECVTVSESQQLACYLATIDTNAVIATVATVIDVNAVDDESKFRFEALRRNNY